MGYFEYIFKSMGGFFYPFIVIIGVFIFGAVKSYYLYYDLIGFYILGILLPIYLTAFYIDYRKAKKRKTGLFREDNK